MFIQMVWKRTKLEDFPSYNRGGQGVIALKTSDRNGNMVSAISVDENDGIMLISDKGTLIRTAVVKCLPRQKYPGVK